KIKAHRRKYSVENRIERLTAEDANGAKECGGNPQRHDFTERQECVSVVLGLGFWAFVQQGHCDFLNPFNRDSVTLLQGQRMTGWFKFNGRPLVILSQVNIRLQ